MRRTLILGTAILLMAVRSAAAADEGFQPLFDGKSLDGWQGDEALWSVADGAIVGSTEAKTIRHNSFLSTDTPYKNFVLKLKFKLRNGNSGVQYRSRQHDDFVVKGYQADIADQRFMGILYEEGGRGILNDVDPKQVYEHVNKDDWNEYVITADGRHLTHQLNGYTTVDYTEESDVGATDGIIALQLHVGPKMQVMFKDIQIKELP